MSNPVRPWFAARPASVRGMIWCLLAAVAFMFMVMIVRHLSADFNAGELAFWRALFGLALMVPVFSRTGSALFRTDRFGMHLFRNLMHFVAIAGWYYAISGINLSVGMSLQVSVPLITIVLAIVFLREKVDAARWIAAVLGFAGVLIILRPGVEPVTLFAVAALVSAAGYAGANIATKMLMPGSSSDTIVFYMNLIHLPLAFGTAMLMGGLGVPSLEKLPWLVGLGASATLAHWLLAQALGARDLGRLACVALGISKRLAGEGNLWRAIFARAFPCRSALSEGPNWQGLMRINCEMIWHHPFDHAWLRVTAGELQLPIAYIASADPAALLRELLSLLSPDCQSHGDDTICMQSIMHSHILSACMHIVSAPSI